jgi:hypothetical protein
VLSFIVALQPHHHGGQAFLVPFDLSSTLTSPPPVLPTTPSGSVYNPLGAPDELELLLIEVPYLVSSFDHPEFEDLQEDPFFDPHEPRKVPQSAPYKDLHDPWTPHAVSSDQSMKTHQKWGVAFFTTLFGWASLASLFKVLNPNPNPSVVGDEAREEAKWISSSSSWIDRQACRYFGLCGTAHFQFNRPFRRHGKMRFQEPLGEQEEWQTAWTSGKPSPENWTDDERVLREVPQYVLDYAPLVHLYSGEEFWPSDIAEHLYHITPYLNYTPVQSRWQHPKLNDLDGLNKWEKGRFVYLTSNDNVEDRPEWLAGDKNIPERVPGLVDDNLDDEPWAEWDGRVDGELPADIKDGRKPWYDAGKGGTRDRGGGRPNPTAGSRIAVPTETVEGEDYVIEYQEQPKLKRSLIGKRMVGGRSEAPAVLIAIDKGNGIVDAFWFYFYSYNLGNLVFNVRFGNHVGDWEHSLIRFKDGKPKAVFFSEHSFGEAYSYEAVEKIGQRVRIKPSLFLPAIANVFPARDLFRSRHPCHVCAARCTFILIALGSSSRPYGPWAALGPPAQFSSVHV